MTSNKKKVIITTGEPAGIGPDISLMAAASGKPIVLLGCMTMLQSRAKQLGLTLSFSEYKVGEDCYFSPNHCVVWHVPLSVPAIAGVLNSDNASYVLSLLDKAMDACMAGHFSAMVTAPLHKAIINKAGIAFSGHTEYLAKATNTEQVVMMLACDVMRVALVTTHLPLSDVPKAITKERLQRVINVLDSELKQRFAIAKPALYVCGLNPHAGEQGYLGREEIDVIEPTLQAMSDIDLHGPYPADTLFTSPFLKKADVFLAMYHDQGLSVLKYAGFGESVNITLGLPLIRTSVDHGTALPLAGTGKVSHTSLLMAINTALSMQGVTQCC